MVELRWWVTASTTRLRLRQQMSGSRLAAARRCGHFEVLPLLLPHHLPAGSAQRLHHNMRLCGNVESCLATEALQRIARCAGSSCTTSVQGTTACSLHHYLCVQVAIEAADFVLNRSDLEDVVVALDLARATFRRIQINYVFAMLYNVAMVPVAAGALYPAFRLQLPPMWAGLAMALSSVSVVLSSLQLMWYRPPPRVLRDRE